jgi:hypothetical protein
MCSGGDTRALPRVGSPIRKSADQRLFSTSPRLIAAVHVLHRLLTPRHPPRALRILTIEHTYCRYAVFKVRTLSRANAGFSRPAVRPRTPEIALVGRSLRAEQHAISHRDPARHEPLELTEVVPRGGGRRTRSSTLFLGLAPHDESGTGELDGAGGDEPLRAGALAVVGATASLERR